MERLEVDSSKPGFGRVFYGRSFMPTAAIADISD
jgi:hypothetical protein